MEHAEQRDDTDLLTVPEVARKLRVSTERCYELIRKKVLPAVELGRQKRVSGRALTLFIEAGGKGLE